MGTGSVTPEADGGSPPPDVAGRNVEVPRSEADRATAIQALALLEEGGSGTAAYPPSSSMYTPHRDGYNGDEAWVQGTLIALGVQPPPGPIDGWFGPETSNSVAAFQHSAGLEVTGEMNAETWAALQEARQTGEIPRASSGAEPGTQAGTDAVLGTAITAIDSHHPASPAASDHFLAGINANVDAAVLAEYDALVDDGVPPEEARERIVNRYNEGTRTRAMVDASLGRLEASGDVVALAPPGAEPDAPDVATGVVGRDPVATAQ